MFAHVQKRVVRKAGVYMNPLGSVAEMALPLNSKFSRINGISKMDWTLLCSYRVCKTDLFLSSLKFCNIKKKREFIITEAYFVLYTWRTQKQESNSFTSNRVRSSSPISFFTDWMTLSKERMSSFVLEISVSIFATFCPSSVARRCKRLFSSATRTWWSLSNSVLICFSACPAWACAVRGKTK